MPGTVLTILTQVGAIPTLSKLLFLSIALPAVLILLETRFPARSRPHPSRRSLALDLTYWFVNPLGVQIVSKLGVCLVCYGLCAALGWDVDESLLDGFGPLGRQPVWVQALEIVVLADFIDYWTHRWFHIARFWRFHAIHHSPEQMTWLASARMHPVNDFVTRVCQVVPVLLLGLSLKAVLLVVPALVVFVILLHSNLNWDFGPLRWVFVSPRYHRWHHTTDPEGLDKNFAGILPVWDLLFGTLHFPPHEPTRFGVNHDPPPETFWGQLFYPFSQPGTGPEEERCPLPARADGLRSSGTAGVGVNATLQP